MTLRSLDGSMLVLGGQRRTGLTPLGRPPGLISRLAAPVVIAHRGGGALYPEHTLSSYQYAIDNGAVPEVDLQALSDGTLVAMHDTTVDRTTNGTGNVSAKSLAQWQALTVDAGVQAVDTYPAEAPPTMAEILTQFRNRALNVQVYSDTIATALGSLCTSLGVDKRTILVTTANEAWISAITAAGFTYVMVIHDDPATFADLPGLKTAGVTHVGCLDSGVTQAFIDNSHAAGLKVTPYSVFGLTRKNTLVAMGCDGLFSDDPAIHARTSTYQRTTDMFDQQRRWPGHTVIAGGQGQFYSPDAWGWSKTASTTAIARLSYIRPTDPTNFNLDFEANIVDDGGTTTLGFEMWLGNEDYFVNGTPAAPNNNHDGYLATVRRNGSLHLAIYTNGVRDSYLVFNQAVTQPNLDTFYPYRWTVTPTTIRFERSDTGQGFTATNSTHRPLPYVAIDALIAGVKFRNITVT